MIIDAIIQRKSSVVSGSLSRKRNSHRVQFGSIMQERHRHVVAAGSVKRCSFHVARCCDTKYQQLFRTGNCVKWRIVLAWIVLVYQPLPFNLFPLNVNRCRSCR